MKHVNGLDSLRAFAVTTVIIAHWGPVFYEDEPAARFIQKFFIPDGSFGVNVFFVLSGFLITTILLNARATYSNENRLLIIRDFFAKRALRIFPVYYLLFLFLYVINLQEVRSNIWYELTYTMNLLCYKTNSWHSMSHTWTLAIEEQFYLLWPVLIIFIRQQYLKYLFTAAIAVGIVTTVITIEVTSHMEPFLVINCMDAFGIGGLYAYARRNPVTHLRFEQTISGLIVPAIITYLYWKVALYTNHREWGICLSKTVVSIIAIWLIMKIMNNRSRWVQKYILDNRRLNYIGKISYGIYLYHLPYVTLISVPLRHWLAIFGSHHYRTGLIVSNPVFLYCLDLAFVLAIAGFSWRFIERPLSNLKKHLLTPGKQKQLTSIA